MAKKNDSNMILKERTYYAGLDVWKLLMSSLVVFIHCGILESLLPSNAEKWIEFLRDISITGFFCANGFFAFKSIDLKKQKDSIRFWGKWKKIVFKYLIWNGIYLPLMLYGEFFVYHSSLFKGILKILRALFLTGWHYYSWTLWYMLALVISLAVIGICIKKIKSIYILFFTSCLYLIGTTMDYLYKAGSSIKIIQLYYSLFYTTRNAFFYGLFFISFGMFLAEKKGKNLFTYKTNIFILILSGGIFLSSNNWWITRICAAVICCSLFLIILNISLPKSKKWLWMRKISIYIYFVHMYYVALFELVLRKYLHISNFEMFLGVVGCSFFTAIILEFCKTKFNWKWLSYLF